MRYESAFTSSRFDVPRNSLAGRIFKHPRLLQRLNIVPSGGRPFLSFFVAPLLPDHQRSLLAPTGFAQASLIGQAR